MEVPAVGHVIACRLQGPPPPRARQQQSSGGRKRQAGAAAKSQPGLNGASATQQKAGSCCTCAVLVALPVIRDSFCPSVYHAGTSGGSGSPPFCCAKAGRQLHGRLIADSVSAGQRGRCSRRATHGVWRKAAQVAEAQEVEWHHYISGWLCCAVGAILTTVTVTKVDLNAVVLCFTLIGHGGHICLYPASVCQTSSTYRCVLGTT